MNGPLTDRERCRVLEARVAELEEELVAWRGSQAQDLREEKALQRAVGIRDRLQLLDKRCALVAVGMLIRMVDHPGAAITKQQLVDASRHHGVGRMDDEPALKIVNVQVNFLRNALAKIGLRSAVETIWGVGYRVSPANAERLKVLLEAAHD